MTRAEEALDQASAARGDGRAWERLFLDNFEAVAAFVRWRTARQGDLADDVLQETWMLAARKVAAFDPDRGCFRAWVCGLAANVVRSHLRARGRLARRFVPLNGSEVAHTETGHADRVAWALAGLPTHYEAVLRAKYLDGQTVGEIAADRGVSVKAVESLLTRARGAFRELYLASDHD